MKEQDIGTSGGRYEPPNFKCTLCGTTGGVFYPMLSIEFKENIVMCDRCLEQRAVARGCVWHTIERSYS